MYYQEYLSLINKKINIETNLNISGLQTYFHYEEIFKWQWFATKLKLFSYVTYVNCVDQFTVQGFSKDCITHAKQNCPGLPPGFQNGIACFVVIASENVDYSAINFVTSPPPKDFSAMLIPIVFDLSKNQLYSFQGRQLWGAAYAGFLNQFAQNNFNAY